MERGKLCASQPDSSRRSAESKQPSTSWVKGTTAERRRRPAQAHLLLPRLPLRVFDDLHTKFFWPTLITPRLGLRDVKYVNENGKSVSGHSLSQWEHKELGEALSSIISQMFGLARITQAPQNAAVPTWGKSSHSEAHGTCPETVPAPRPQGG